MLKTMLITVYSRFRDRRTVVHIPRHANMSLWMSWWAYSVAVLAVLLVLNMNKTKIKSKVRLWPASAYEVSCKWTAKYFYWGIFHKLYCLCHFWQVSFNTPWNGCLRKAFVKTNWVRPLAVLIQGFVLGWWEWARESLNKYLRPPSTSLPS